MKLSYYTEEELMSYVCGFMDIAEENTLEAAMQENNELAARVFRCCTEWNSLMVGGVQPVALEQVQERPWERRIQAFIAAECPDVTNDGMINLDGKKQRYLRIKKIDLWIYVTIGVLSILLIVLIGMALSGS